jgi:S-adenosylmethionine/arginine decarboxylase-like enzyme
MKWLKLDKDICACTYATKGTVGIDIFKYVQTESGAKALKKFVEQLEKDNNINSLE